MIVKHQFRVMVLPDCCSTPSRLHVITIRFNRVAGSPGIVEALLALGQVHVLYCYLCISTFSKGPIILRIVDSIERISEGRLQ